MNTIHYMTKEQALRIALLNTGLENSEYRCLSNHYDGGFFRIILRTPYLNYEIYVDAETEEIAGVDTEPVPYQEALCLCSDGEDRLTNAA